MLPAASTVTPSDTAGLAETRAKPVSGVPGAAGVGVVAAGLISPAGVAEVLSVLSFRTWPLLAVVSLKPP
jgi:hypothetical protein